MRKILFWFLLLFMAIACTKLPKETQEGKETFGCLVDGKKFIVKSNDGKDLQSLVASYDQINHGIRIWANLYHGAVASGDKEEIFFLFNNYKLEIGRRQIDNFNTITTYLYDVDGKTELYDKTSGYIEITHVDTVSTPKSIAGTFQFEAKSTAATREITKGRFDLMLRIY